MTHIQVQNEKNVLVMSLQYSPATQSILYLFFLKNVRTTKRLNDCGQHSEQQDAVSDSDTPVTVKQSQGHHIWL